MICDPRSNKIKGHAIIGTQHWYFNYPKFDRQWQQKFFYQTKGGVEESKVRLKLSKEAKTKKERSYLKDKVGKVGSLPERPNERRSIIVVCVVCCGRAFKTVQTFSGQSDADVVAGFESDERCEMEYDQNRNIYREHLHPRGSWSTRNEDPGIPGARRRLNSPFDAHVNSFLENSKQGQCGSKCSWGRETEQQPGCLVSS